TELRAGPSTELSAGASTGISAGPSTGLSAGPSTAGLRAGPSTGLRAGRAVGVTIKDEDGSRREVSAKVVVDASGQAGLMQNRLRLRVWDPVLNKGAIWTYWEGAYRDTGRDEGATMVLQTASRNGWFWYIPLHNNIVSVGVVAPFDYVFKNRDNPSNYEQTYHEEVEQSTAVKDRVAGARRAAGYFATKDYSYRAKQVAGNG